MAIGRHDRYPGGGRAMTTMTMKWMLAIGLVVALLGSWPAYSCGPFFEQAIFTYTLHPDLPLTSYAQGLLGILQPTYAQSYLYVAYRYLIGMGFDHEEQAALLALWDERLNPQADLWNPNASAAVKAWSDARAQIAAAGPPPPVNVFKALEARNGVFYYHEYVNCTADAFQTAAHTLSARIEQFGVDSVDMQEWVRAQDQVFGNCSGPRAIPAPAAPQSPEILQKDRAYQIAAAHFYAGDLALAERLFRDIADDQTSHWRLLAPYLVARALLRQGSLIPRYDDVDSAKLSAAQQILHAILGDNNLMVIHPNSRRLLAVVRARLEPAARIHELAQSLLTPNSGATLKHDLWDFTLLLDRI